MIHHKGAEGAEENFFLTKKQSDLRELGLPAALQAGGSVVKIPSFGFRLT
jgi:hypothetical protein